MASEKLVTNCMRFIGEAISVDPEEFKDHETWKFLGLGELLASAVESDLNLQFNANLPEGAFSKYPTVAALRTFLRDQRKGEDGSSSKTDGLGVVDPWQGIAKPKVPLSTVLQGSPRTSTENLFLFPDGSGAGTSYSTLPPMGGRICVIGLNSPFLRQAREFTCSIQTMAKLWLGELRKLQPRGPYSLGGWSAGGYYSYEVAKLLVAAGEKVNKLILIDSPCRLRFEALPQEVVAELTRKGLMGASAEKKAPEWLVQHFNSTVLSVDKYMPTPISRGLVPEHVHFIWVREGLVQNVTKSGLDVDLSVKVTRFLLEPRDELLSEGWEELLPGAQYTFDYISGNHFQITQPPHSHSLGKILAKVMAV